MRRLGWVIVIPLAVVAVVFAVNNNAESVISLWPFPIEFHIPLYVVAFAGIIIGFIAGALIAWLSASRWRRMARREARESESLKRELAQAEARAAERRPAQEMVTPSAGAPASRYAGAPQGRHDAP